MIIFNFVPGRKIILKENQLREQLNFYLGVDIFSLYCLS